jgi:uncharacterized protein YqgC (DUF456 family)
MTPAKMQPALLGGVVIGVLSALPVISVGNCCCGAWILFGGALAAYLMQQNHPEPILISDGAIVGLLAGVIGAFVSAIVSIPINIALGPFQSELFRNMSGSADLPPELRVFFEQFGQAPTIVGVILGFFVMLLLCIVFGMLGGLFGALMFRKNHPPPGPPPIPPIPPIPPTVF